MILAAPARSTRSHAAPAGRTKSSRTQQRPQLHVVEKRSAQRSQQRGLSRVWAWTKSKSMPVVHVIAAVVFLTGCWLGSLMLRTEMNSNSFEASRIEQHIGTLQQDIDDDQAKLSQLESTLPERAQKMHMVPSQGSLTIDLNGYKPSQGE